MLTDLEYALKQLRPLSVATNRPAVFDRAQRAIDALERCVEEAKAAAAVSAELVAALRGFLHADPDVFRTELAAALAAIAKATL